MYHYCDAIEHIMSYRLFAGCTQPEYTLTILPNRAIITIIATVLLESTGYVEICSSLTTFSEL